MLVKNCTLFKPLFCKQEDTAMQAASILKKNEQRRLFVVDNEGFPIGIISTTDLSNKVAAEGLNPRKILAKDVMTSPLCVICDIEDSLDVIFQKMHDKECYFCPVLKDKKLHGVLTYGELLNRAEAKVYEPR